MKYFRVYIKAKGIKKFGYLTVTKSPILNVPPFNPVAGALTHWAQQ